jgi:hypothetical protein
MPGLSKALRQNRPSARQRRGPDVGAPLGLLMRIGFIFDLVRLRQTLFADGVVSATADISVVCHNSITQPKSQGCCARWSLQFFQPSLWTIWSRRPTVPLRVVLPLEVVGQRHHDQVIAPLDFLGVGEARPAHRSSRRPLKKGCRTLPSADLARYSTSASNFGSTRPPCAQCAWHRAASSGSAASTAFGARPRTTYRSRGPPCRRRPDRLPCVGQRRCRPNCYRPARSRLLPAFRDGRRSP